jgi:hypothetical protein
VEPAETIYCLSEFFLLVAKSELLTHIAVKSGHIWLDTTGRLLSHLERLLKE